MSHVAILSPENITERVKDEWFLYNTFLYVMEIFQRFSQPFGVGSRKVWDFPDLVTLGSEPAHYTCTVATLSRFRRDTEKCREHDIRCLHSFHLGSRCPRTPRVFVEGERGVCNAALPISRYMNVLSSFFSKYARKNGPKPQSHDRPGHPLLHPVAWEHMANSVLVYR